MNAKTIFILVIFFYGFSFLSYSQDSFIIIEKDEHVLLGKKNHGRIYRLDSVIIPSDLPAFKQTSDDTEPQFGLREENYILKSAAPNSFD